MENSNKLSTTNNDKGLNIFSNMESLLEFARTIAGSRIAPAYNTPESVAACFLWAKDNNVPPMNALLETQAINGKVGASAKMIRAMLLRSNITHRTIEDYKPIYGWEFNGTIFQEETINANPTLYTKYGSVELALKGMKDGTIPAGTTPIVPTNLPMDYRTTIVFTRKSPNNMEETVSFLYSEAVQAGLAGKDNWEKNTRAMMYARCYSRGANRIAADAALGMYHIEELDTNYVDATVIDLE